MTRYVPPHDVGLRLAVLACLLEGPCSVKFIADHVGVPERRVHELIRSYLAKRLVDVQCTRIFAGRRRRIIRLAPTAFRARSQALVGR